MIRTEQVALGRVDGHVTHAERPRGGVLILPTITGVDAHMRERAGMLAEAGYSALIWDPYPGSRRPPTCRRPRPWRRSSTTARSAP